MKSDNLDQKMNKEEQVVQCDDSLINVKISDVFTPVTCALLINEILQGLLYQKSQIPYPYNWLKSVVDKKRGISTSEGTARKVNFNAANHFRVVSSAYDTLENIMKGIIKEFSERNDFIKEVVFVFGATPVCPKEIYSIKIPSLAKGHLERNHTNPVCKYRQKILRNIFLSQQWLDTVDSSMSCTNTYIFFKTTETCNRSSTVDSRNDFFIPSRPVTVPSKAKHTKINLNYEASEKRNCCDNFFVFEDVNHSDANQRRTSENNQAQETIVWYQSKDLFKGFKDCYINKVSASELW
ncbi:MAD2L1-binding protein [Anoplophora glabripennis]|uniref:MAD2L1-binding protein n=1 Tax=Anoplophora glabripennis TaxID=217634 RepID=UPI0008736F99|nr:MAD2L1-binding protein [Anoplophora glabripennis]